MRIAIGLLVSHGFPAPSAFWESYEQVMSHISTGATNTLLPADRAITGVRRIKSTAFPVDVARNQIVGDFLSGDEDYLFFMDADMTFPANIVGRLLAHDVAVVTGRYHSRKIPYHPVVYVKHRYKDGPHCYAPVHFGKGLIEIERAGAGALLIRRDVAEAINAKVGPNWFRYQRGPEPPHDFTVSEDFWFFQQARECGYTIYCDWDVECEHLQEMGINRSWNEAYLDAQVREFATMTPEAKQAALDAFVVCGFPDGITLASGDRVPPYSYSPGER
jgi:hypothetical protein